jgi:hypothetical protein
MSLLDAKLAEAAIRDLEPLVVAVLDTHPGASVMVAVDQLARMACRLSKLRNPLAHNDEGMRLVIRQYLLASFDREVDEPL